MGRFDLIEVTIWVGLTVSTLYVILIMFKECKQTGIQINIKKSCFRIPFMFSMYVVFDYICF
jgi:hypothetical protein